jgi:hypothetical protein
MKRGRPELPGWVIALKCLRRGRSVAAFPQRDVHLDGSETLEIRLISDKNTRDKT